jgi:predicted  nucleic acid-binding Zn-ribbon protein
MTFRDEHEAQRERVDALEQELERTKEDLAIERKGPPEARLQRLAFELATARDHLQTLERELAELRREVAAAPKVARERVSRLLVIVTVGALVVAAVVVLAVLLGPP